MIENNLFHPKRNRPKRAILADFRICT